LQLQYRSFPFKGKAKGIGATACRKETPSPP
jgi:hypothetical protein